MVEGVSASKYTKNHCVKHSSCNRNMQRTKKLSVGILCSFLNEIVFHQIYYMNSNCFVGSFTRTRPGMFSVGEPSGRLLERHLLTANASMVDDCGIHCTHNDCSGFIIIRNECIIFSL